MPLKLVTAPEYCTKTELIVNMASIKFSDNQTFCVYMWIYTIFFLQVFLNFAKQQEDSNA